MMERPLVIDVEGVGKTYRLGVLGGGSLADDVGAWFARSLGKPDPRLPIGASEARAAGDMFEALRDITFHMRQGELLGIIGRNGAGKSTLLKLLSRITLPSTGTIRMRGRVGSLLEVGTGFNPELTGRENIWLNGAILGMKKAEIGAKLASIIAFSGIEHHIDTPVKRYSSGMKVRLGFAVAAHLEPEILIIDEVLAVGDAEFQRKCIGKMKDVAGSGRTILFVSHNMTAVRSLCTRVIWLDQGRVRMDGPTDAVVREYLASGMARAPQADWSPADAPTDGALRLDHLSVAAPHHDPITLADPILVRIGFHNMAADDGDVNFVIHVFNDEETLVFSSGWREDKGPLETLERGAHRIECTVPANLLNSGEYAVSVLCFRKGRIVFKADLAVVFEVHEPQRDGTWFGRRYGILRPRLEWTHTPKA